MHQDDLYATVHVAIPAMGESGWLPTVLESLIREKAGKVRFWVCVNQPDAWWTDEENRSVCLDNRDTLLYLRSLGADNLHIIDRSSPGKGWKGKQHGVGHARKLLMDTIDRTARDTDILLSLDADSLFDPGYIQSVRDCFQSYPNALALSNPYFHQLSGDERLDRSMLRYEIYMRYYVINMWRIGSPYSFTALGSAMAMPIHTYRSIGGITPKKSGEDFYLLQKIRKAGWICQHNSHKVYPATRYSDRVFFGTGPALIKGSRGDWTSYPIYPHDLFDQVGQSYAQFPALYTRELDTPIGEFLAGHFRERDPFAPLRANARSVDHFVRACHQKVDGLRVLQFLKASSKSRNTSDEGHLKAWYGQHHPHVAGSDHKTCQHHLKLNEDESRQWHQLDFQKASISLLDKIRCDLQRVETSYQINDLA